MANSARISCMCAVTDKFVRSLATDPVMFARIWIAPVDHLTGIKNYFILAAKILGGPVSWQFVIAINADHSHAANEADVTKFIVLVANVVIVINASYVVKIGPGFYFEYPFCFCWTSVHVEY